MIHPLVPYAIRGAIWYQGESNRERAEQYRELFPALIHDWRMAFGRASFPFYFVQIAPFAYEGDTGQAGALRDAQRLTLAKTDTGMAVTMDIGDPADIHPLKKREVGERLALWALAKTYGRELECSGPLYRGMQASGGAIRIEFEHARGLTSRGEPVRHATIAGADRAFHPAEARIEGETLVVSSPDVKEPVAVRFGWGAADMTNLWNAAGLPASSFRTDDWP
jgi:sialate O-acetylesterase